MLGLGGGNGVGLFVQMNFMRGESIGAPYHRLPILMTVIQVMPMS